MDKVYNGPINSPTEYKGWLIGMGSKTYYQAANNPSSQFVYFNSPPKIRGIQRFKSQLQAIVESYMHQQSPLSSATSTTIDPSLLNSFPTHKVAIADDTPLEALEAAQNISLFLDDFQSGSKTKDQTL